MKDDLTSVEQKLRSLKWRIPKDGLLEDSLKAALAARAVQDRKTGRSTNFVPRPLRWPLAALWTASLFFWWFTPQAAPLAATTVAHRESAADPHQMMAQKNATQELTHELLLAIENRGQRW